MNLIRFVVLSIAMAVTMVLSVLWAAVALLGMAIFTVVAFVWHVVSNTYRSLVKR